MRVMFTVLYLTVGIKGLASRPCVQDPKTYTIGELERIINAVAYHKGVPSTVILNRILRKIRLRQRTEMTTPKNPLQELALEELVNTKFRPPSPDQSLPPPLPPSFRPPPMRPVSEPRPFPPSQPPQGSLMTGVLFTPGYSSRGGPFSQPFYIPMQTLQPPPGVLIRVDSDKRDNPLPEVMVTLSPMMTVVEALNQAESKYRSYLGLSPLSENPVISFSRSSINDCFVIGNFQNVGSSAGGFWRIIVHDRTGTVIYESTCLPSRNEVPVKPGMVIRLIYTSL